jgi:hydroxymethylpyrimidine/phosphomethylpyrimidine kinase
VAAVLVIAGSDSSGGAGLTRDIQVLRDFEVDALCALTAVTAQSDAAVHALYPVPAAIVQAQIEAARSTRLDAIKIGMLGTADVVEAVAATLPERTQVPIVLDPVLLASSGGALLDADGRACLCDRLLPRVTLLTPNVPEAAQLLGREIVASESALIDQAAALLAFGPQAVLLKGGHATGAQAIDWLVGQDGTVHRMVAARLSGRRRGTGCALASAIAAILARGETLETACREAKRYLWRLLPGAPMAGAP